MIFDNYYYGKDRQCNNLCEDLRHSVFKIDVRNGTGKIEMELQHNKPDFIFHLAALSSAPMCSAAPVDAMNVNVNGFQTIMEAAWYYKIKKVVYASTSSMYAGHQLPWNENICITPHTVYEASFHNREALAWSYFHEFGVQSVGLRFFSVYGPNEKHKGKYANNVSQFLWDIQDNRSPILYGDGNQTRDFVYVDDVVEALKLAAFSDHELLKCNIVNVGTGQNMSFNGVINLINGKLDKSIRPEYRTNPLNNYVRHTKADVSKASHLLRWRPKTTVVDGIDKLIEFYAN